MSKVIMQWGYKEVVVDADKAIAMAELISGAEIYEAKYHSKTDTTDSHQTYHIYPMAHGDNFSMRIITNEQYQLYKLAGRPI